MSTWVFVLLVVIVFLLVIYFKLYRRVSITSGITNLFILLLQFKKNYITEESAAKLLEKNATINELPLRLPRLKSKVTIEMVDGFPVYTLTPPEPNGESEIFYLHGGAYTLQPEPFHWMMLDRFAGMLGMRVLVPVYPKAPKYNHEKSFDFIVSVYKTRLQKGAPRLLLMGDSSGGGFALSLSQFIRDTNFAAPSLLVLISPWLDVSMKNPEIQRYEKKDILLGVEGLKFIGRVWAGDTDIEDSLVSPINGSLKDLPPILFFVGTDEVFLPDARKFSILAREAGVDFKYYEYKGMKHDFPIMPIPESRKMLMTVVSEVNKRFQLNRTK